MKIYRITIKSTGADMGTYEAETEAGAVEAMHRDAGYVSTEHAARALCTTAETLMDDCDVAEVSAV